MNKNELRLILEEGEGYKIELAEGCGRGSEAEFAQFLQIAMGSASELESHLLLAHDLGFLKGSAYHQLESDVCE